MINNEMHAFQNLPTPCAITDIDGKILSVNQALCEVLGKTCEQIIGVQLDTITTLASRIFMQTHVWPMLRKQTRVKELFIKLKDATQSNIPVMVDGVLKTEDDAERCYWVFYIAQERAKFEKELISARQEVEAINIKLSHSQQALKAANEELERFNCSVSHDLRSPLVTISGFVSKLQQELNNDLTDKQKHRFDRINSNVKKMQALMNDLLKLSSLSRQQIEFEMVDLAHLCYEQLELIDNPLTEIDAKIIMSPTMPKVASNKTLLGQCIGNLLTNALAYREPSRQLQINISTQEVNDKVIVHVADNGIGIAQKDQQRIFNIFEHLNESKGTGVGLSIVKTAVEKLNATITVNSEVGKGSTFILTLPTELPRVFTPPP